MFLTTNFLNDLLDINDAYNTTQTKTTSKVNYYVSTTDTTQTITIALPGFQKSDIFMNTTNRTDRHSTLNVSAEISEDRLNSNPFLFNFKTKFAISNSFNLEEIKANMSDGILTITIPKNKIVDLSRTIQID